MNAGSLKSDSVRAEPAGEFSAAVPRRLSYSIVALTYNRNRLLERLLTDLQVFAAARVEIIIVDNASVTPAELITRRYPGVTLIRAPRNLGAAGRNLGFEAARGDIVICLDDDVYALSHDALERLDEIFTDERIAAVNFTVLEEGTGRIVNWVHHRSVERFAHTVFDTYEITEGAVAFRRSALQRAGGYPETFFLSHEGPDLAYRIMDQGVKVIYSPALRVTHSFAQEGRPSWRKYYYDTRNTLWLAARNLPAGYGARLVMRQSAAMLLYSVRDGYCRWWAKGIWDGVLGLRRALSERRQLSRDTMRRIREIDSHRPPLRYLIRKRLLGGADMRL
jgi:GT2 family glycosyltransferase